MNDTTRRCLFVVGRQRSGTTVLRRALASHTRVRDLGEVMHDKRKVGFYTVLADTLATNISDGLHARWCNLLITTAERLAPPPDDSVLLLDIKYNMALSFGSSFEGTEVVSTFAQFLRRNQANVIHIVRRNKLALITSAAVASATNQWERKPNDEERFEPVIIPPQSLLGRIREEEAMDAWFTAQFDKLRGLIRVVYEDMFDADGHFLPAPFEHVAQRMGIAPDFNLAPRLVKQGRPLSEAIANFGEVAGQIEGLIAAGAIAPVYREYLRS